MCIMVMILSYAKQRIDLKQYLLTLYQLEAKKVTWFEVICQVNFCNFYR